MPAPPESGKVFKHFGSNMKQQAQAITMDSQDDVLKRRLLDFDFFLLCISVALFGNAIVEILNVSGF